MNPHPDKDKKYAILHLLTVTAQLAGGFPPVNEKWEIHSELKPDMSPKYK